ncbi:MAG: energy-coupling factor transporter transmembrane component T [Candidatus Nanoarchaeia archaeon]|nr:energy-coupling factor transporter transmembrane component T [Candidatus Nanoarchaeia archaeon]
MASNILLSYVHKDSYFHKIDPSTKLLITVLVILLTFILKNYIHIMILLLFIFPIGIKSKVLRMVFKPVSQLFLIFILLFIIQGLFYPLATDKLMDLPFGFTLWKDGLVNAANVGSRLLVMMVFGFWFVLTTHPGDLVSSLRKIGLPNALGYIMITTLQMIPRIQSQMKTIIDAQKSRGLETTGNLIKKFKSYLPLLGPLFMGSVQQAVEKSMALEARAFSSDCPKTNYRKTTIHLKDKIIMISAVALSIMGVILSWTL